MTETHTLSHTTWNCKYHIVFAPKYRRKEFYEARRLEVGQILRQLCDWKGVNIIEAEVCPDHICAVKCSSESKAMLSAHLFLLYCSQTGRIDFANMFGSGGTL